MYSTNISDDRILPLVVCYSAKMHDFLHSNYLRLVGLFKGTKLHKTAELAYNQMAFLTRNKKKIYIFCFILACTGLDW